MPEHYYSADLDKAAQRGEPSAVWRDGQRRRLEMIRRYGAESMRGRVLVNGTGIGAYQSRMADDAQLMVGLDIEFPRLLEAKEHNTNLVCAKGEELPFASGCFDGVLSNEVLEHVQDDRQAVEEISRVLVSGGRLLIFCPNRGYPFETHGIYRKGEYQFGNKLFVNYLPRRWRDKLAPHVRVYSRRDLSALAAGLPFKKEVVRTIFGGYDNIVQRMPAAGKALRALLQWMERTPLQRMGLSHLWVLRKE
jgi:SAM-dependent methyltransferase